MQRSVPCLLGPAFAVLCFATFAAAQSPQSDKTAAAPQTPVATLHSSTQLVVVDVVVTDKNHKPVHGLKESDFALTEENLPQSIKHFEEHSALTAAEATKFTAIPKLPPGLFTNYSPEPINGAVDILLFDALNTPLKDQMFVRQQLLAFLKSAQPGVRIAIFGLTSHLTILQGFTSDPETLKKIASMKFKTSPLLQDSTGGNGIQNSMSDDMEDMGLPADQVANVRQFEAEAQSFQTQLRVKYTLDAMNQLARYLSSIPGRKNLIWFSASFPISILPDTTGTLKDPFAVAADAGDEFRDTVNLLARSQVAVYPIDARGLFSSEVYSAATSRNYVRNPARMQQDLDKFSTDTNSEHSTMSEMAEATGGHAFFNTNGLAQAVAAAIDEGSNFYTLSYTPSNQTRNGEFRKIKVQLARQGFTLAYRHGYYADDPSQSAPMLKNSPKQSSVIDAAVATSATTAQQNLRVAMMRGSPTPSEILMKVGVFPLTSPTQTEDKPADGNILSEKVQGPFRRYSVTYAINPGDITFLRETDGKIHADFDLVVFVFNPDGVLVNRRISSLHISSPLEDIKKNVAHGIQYNQEVSAPSKGEYFFRIAVHDNHRDRFGAVEVAASEVNNLSLPSIPSPDSTSSPTNPK